MQRFLAYLGLLVVAVGIVLSITSWERKSSEAHYTSMNLNCRTTDPSTANRICEGNFATNPGKDTPLFGVTLALSGIAIEIAAFVLPRPRKPKPVAPPQPMAHPAYQPHP